MELRVKRMKPGVFSVHTLDGQPVKNVEHLETRYMGDQVISHVKIVTRAQDLGKFEKASPEAKEPKAAPKKKTEEQNIGSESKPA